MSNEGRTDGGRTMDREEVLSLGVGERVIWDGKKEDVGIVVALGFRSIEIEWEDGQRGWIHELDCEKVTREYATGQRILATR